MHKLKECDEREWGLTRVEYTFRHKQKMRQIQRERRARYLLRAVTIPKVESADKPLYEVARLNTPDGLELGIRTYKRRTVNRQMSTSSTGETYVTVTMPFVSILGRSLRSL